MRLYLVQHGEAKPKEADPDRPLTQKGISDVRRIGAFLKPRRLRVSAIWHSGKMRSTQTAELLHNVVEAAGGLVERKGIKPDDDVRPVLAELERVGADTMLVGHMPFLGKLAGRLLAGDEAAEPMAFQKGCIACLERGDDGIWRLAWMLTPEIV